MRVWAPRSAYRAKQDDAWSSLQSEILACTSSAELDGWLDAFTCHRARDLPDHWGELVREACGAHRAELVALARSSAMDRIIGQIDRGMR